MPELNLMVAVADNDVIGRNGQLPWDHPEDRAFFFEHTRGHVVVMGRRTWEEAGAPLEGRHSVVVSRELVLPPGVERAPSLDQALALAWARDPAPFVIGGSRIFTEAMPRVTRALITRVPGRPDGDATFHFDPTGFALVHERTGAGGLRFQEWLRRPAP
jgi:dihydrofolate reductase